MRTAPGWYQDAGPIMLLILLVGACGFAIMAERLYVIVFHSKNNARVFIERIIQMVRAGKIDEAIQECVASTAVLPDMGLLILRSRSRDERDLQNVADAAALIVVPNVTRRLQYLPSLATGAVLLGLLGTVRGFHDTLLASGARGGEPQLAAGFAQALVPTVFALGIATALILGRSYLVSQSEALTGQIREFSARLINALIDRPDVRLGHR